MKTSPGPRTPKSDPHLERRRAVMRIFEEEGWGSLELVDEWDGADLDELRSILRASEYETLLDRLRDQGDARR
ncbi:MAG TPA: hypothetical protein VF530_06390 [Planctomycetota bacterium]